MLNNVEAERARLGYTRKELAEKIGIAPRTYCNYISEDTSITSDVLFRLAHIFGTSIEYLLEGSRFATVTTK